MAITGLPPLRLRLLLTFLVLLILSSDFVVMLKEKSCLQIAEEKLAIATAAGQVGTKELRELEYEI